MAVLTVGSIERAWEDADAALIRMQHAAEQLNTEHDLGADVCALAETLQAALFAQLGIEGEAAARCSHVFDHISHITESAVKIASEQGEVNKEAATGARTGFAMLMAFAFGMAAGRRQAAP